MCRGRRSGRRLLQGTVEPSGQVVEFRQRPADDKRDPIVLRGIDEQAAVRLLQLLQLLEQSGPLFAGPAGQEVHHQGVAQNFMPGVIASASRFLNSAENFVPAGNDNCGSHREL
jgi:hypothetical protein